MASTGSFGLGYQRVDEKENVSFHVATMDDTARWEAIRQLRSWEREHLGLRPGARLLDVGCGLGEAGRALAADLGPTGEVVGVDASEAMLAVARERAVGASCPVRYVVGDALALDAPDASFDAARSERTLQWLSDPQAVVDQLARVLRPGGHLALIDTDWSTLHLDVGDAGVTRAVHEALRTERGRASLVGRRLGALASTAGLDPIAETSATHTWTEWDPDENPAPDGCFSMENLAEDLVDAGQLDPAGAERFVTTIHDAARRGHFTMTLTMFGVVATSPHMGLRRRPARTAALDHTAD